MSAEDVFTPDAVFAIAVVLMLIASGLCWFVCQAFERAFDLEDKQ